MAMYNLRCPSCGGEIQMDDKLEKGYCKYCGGAILIKEEIQKFQVEIDYSKKLANTLKLADRAFTTGNYYESYNYCCAALECDANNFHAIFRKGLNAACLSLERINEFEQGIITAKEVIDTTSKNADNDTFQIFSEAMDYIQSAYTLNCDRPKTFIYPSLASANYTFFLISTLTRLCALCSDLISDEMINKHPSFENDKKSCLDLALHLCKMGISPLKYTPSNTGSTYGSNAPHELAKSPYLDIQKSYQAKFKNEYNNLPTIKNALMGYDGEIAHLQRDIDAYTRKLDEYFKANPQLGKTYKRSALPFAILTGIAFLFVIVVLVTCYEKGLDSASIWLICFYSCIFGALAIFTIVQMVKNSKSRKKIIQEFPPDLASLKNIHDQSKARLNTVTKTKDAFVKKNLKK